MRQHSKIQTRPTAEQMLAGTAVGFGLTALLDDYGKILVTRSGCLWYPPAGIELTNARTALATRRKTMTAQKVNAPLNKSAKLRQRFAGITWEWRGWNGSVGEWVPVDVQGNRILGLNVVSTGYAVYASLTAEDTDARRTIVSKGRQEWRGNSATIRSRRDQRYFDAMLWASNQYQTGAMYR